MILAKDSKTSYMAAIDLGSNSFHMIVAKQADHQIQVIDKIREMVQLGAGLQTDHSLHPLAQDRALDCLKMFGQRLRAMPMSSVRAVGTNTLRQLRDGGKFLQLAHQALDHPIEIISGREEARLIYLGVAHSLATQETRRLVMDIGGGSTEFIVGEHFEPEDRESLYMGSVSYTRRFFPSGKIDAACWKRAALASGLELQNIESAFRQAGWDTAIGASGTILSIAKVLEELGWSESGINMPGLRKLKGLLIEKGDVSRIDFESLNPERRAIFPAGVAILKTSMKALRIEQLEISDGALREGLLYDLLGRIHQEDPRANTVNAMAKRFQIDTVQANEVEKTANSFFNLVAREWELEGDNCRLILGWAAHLHEIGLAIAHSQYHKHGAYLISNSDMPGFSQTEQQLIATLIRGHRRKLYESMFSELGEETRVMAMRLSILLRLAILLNRSRSGQPLPEMRLIPGVRNLNVSISDQWLEEHPLTLADLELETEYLKAARFKLFVNHIPA